MLLLLMHHCVRPRRQSACAVPAGHPGEEVFQGAVIVAVLDRHLRAMHVDIGTVLHTVVYAKDQDGSVQDGFDNKQLLIHRPNKQH
jgi:hypothetical protein